MFHKVTFVCKENEVNRIRINCRCGHIETHEVPKMLEQSDMLLVCPPCGAAFAAAKFNGKFIIRRLGSKDEMHYANPSDVGA